MIKHILVIFAIAISANLVAQDIIYLSNGDTVYNTLDSLYQKFGLLSWN